MSLTTSPRKQNVSGKKKFSGLFIFFGVSERENTEAFRDGCCLLRPSRPFLASLQFQSQLTALKAVAKAEQNVLISLWSERTFQPTTNNGNYKFCNELRGYITSLISSAFRISNFPPKILKSRAFRPSRRLCKGRKGLAFKPRVSDFQSLPCQYQFLLKAI